MQFSFIELKIIQIFSQHVKKSILNLVKSTGSKDANVMLVTLTLQKANFLSFLSCSFQNWSEEHKSNQSLVYFNVCVSLC